MKLVHSQLEVVFFVTLCREKAARSETHNLVLVAAVIIGDMMYRS